MSRRRPRRISKPSKHRSRKIIDDVRAIQAKEEAYIDNTGAEPSEHDFSGVWGDNLEIVQALTPQQRMFCEHYLETRDSKRAYMSAYPRAKEESARTSGYRTLQLPQVRRYLDLLIESYGPLPRLSMGEILAEIERVAMNDDIDSAQKLKALTILGQRHGDLVEKVEVTERTIVVDIIDYDEDDEEANEDSED